jgi:threonine/homoserine/homoserine lactone efflux protein
MFDASQLALFVSAAAVLVLIPGPNTLFLLAQGMAGGRSAAIASAFGIEVGTLVHTVATGLGLSLFLSHSAVGFKSLQYIGASYLVFLGWRAFHRVTPAFVSSRAIESSPCGAFRQAVVTNLLNPKVAMFFLAFLPQFVHPERGHVRVQFLILGLIVASLGLACGVTVAFAASSIGQWMRHNPQIAKWQQRLTGTVLVGLGLHVVLMSRT